MEQLLIGILIGIIVGAVTVFIGIKKGRGMAKKLLEDISTEGYSYESMGLIFPEIKEKSVSVPEIKEHETYGLKVSVAFWYDSKCPECKTKVSETGASESRWAVYYECPNCKIKLMQQAWAQGQEPWLSKNNK